MKRRIFSILLALCMCLMLLPATVFAEPTKTWYVTQSGAGDQDGSNWANASPNLENVMNVKAQEGDEIWVAKGTYSPSNDPTDTFHLKKGVKVYGGFSGLGNETELGQRNWVNNVTTLSGNDKNYHVVTCNDPTATPDDTRLDGFTVTQGNAYDYAHFYSVIGGGMLNSNSSPTVANCTFSGNKAYNGGGMYNETTTGDPSSPRIENCTFSGNTASIAGGMYNSNSNPTLMNCTFSGNTADDRGGGMSNNDSSPTVENCTFSGNKATNGGGGMYNSNSSPTVENCTFSGNNADYFAGGMYNSNSNPTLMNCTFFGNTATNGGGMNNDNSSPTVANCTFSGNTATNGGGGGMRNYESSPTAVNCTFSGNNAGYGGGMLSYNSNLTVMNCTLSGNTATTLGGGMYNIGDANNLILANTILWGNTAGSADDGPDIFQNFLNNAKLTLNHCVVDVDNKCKFINGPTVNQTNVFATDPKLILLGTNGNTVTDPANVYIYGLGNGSSALNAGLGLGNAVNGVYIPDKDQRGTTRPQGTGVDIGAFEAVFCTVTYDNNDGVGDMAADTAVAGAEFELPTCTFTPPTGKQFITWAIGSAGSATTVNAGSTYTFTANTTVYAIWGIPVTGVSLDKSSITLNEGDTDTLTATVKPDTATNRTVTWSSDKPEIASVDNDGMVTAESPGQATITVTTNDGKKTANCLVTVNAAAKEETITFDPAGGKWPDGTTAPKTIMAKVGAEIMIPEAPVREGYEFQHWEGSAYQPGQIYRVPSGGHTFTAVWTKTSPADPTGTDSADPTGTTATTKPSGTNKETKPGEVLPKTGENAGTDLLASLLLLAAGTLLLVLRKKKAEQRG